MLEPRTPDELLDLPDGKAYELVSGQLRQRHSSPLTSFVASRLASLLARFVQHRNAGWIFESTNGYACFGENTVRRPKVSFVTKTRLSASGIEHDWLSIAPDLAVEIVSPRDNARDLERKLDDYRSAGVPVVWIIYPDNGSAWVHHLDGTSRRLVGPDVELVGEGPLEGFACRLDALLPAPA